MSVKVTVPALTPGLVPPLLILADKTGKHLSAVPWATLCVPSPVLCMWYGMVWCAYRCVYVWVCVRIFISVFLCAGTRAHICERNCTCIYTWPGALLLILAVKAGKQLSIMLWVALVCAGIYVCICPRVRP